MYLFVYLAIDIDMGMDTAMQVDLNTCVHIDKGRRIHIHVYVCVYTYI